MSLTSYVYGNRKFGADRPWSEIPQEEKELHANHLFAMRCISEGSEDAWVNTKYWWVRKAMLVHSVYRRLYLSRN